MSVQKYVYVTWACRYIYLACSLNLPGQRHHIYIFSFVYYLNTLYVLYAIHKHPCDWLSLPSIGICMQACDLPFWEWVYVLIISMGMIWVHPSVPSHLRLCHSRQHLSLILLSSVSRVYAHKPLVFPLPVTYASSRHRYQVPKGVVNIHSSIYVPFPIHGTMPPLPVDISHQGVYMYILLLVLDLITCSIREDRI